MQHSVASVPKDLEQRNIDPTTDDMIFESIPGLSTTLHPQAYMEVLMRWAVRHDVLLATDEVQCGLGRSGPMFAFQHYGITPDLIACGKGMSSIVPASAVIERAEIVGLGRT